MSNVQDSPHEEKSDDHLTRNRSRLTTIESLQSTHSSSSYFLFGTRGVALQRATRVSDVDLAISRAKTVPGPGEYKPEISELTKVVGGRISSSIVKSDVDWAMINAKKIPGPGQYNIPSALNLKGGKFNTSNPLTDIDILQRKGRSEPGPGQYAEPHPAIRGGRFSTACPKSDVDVAMRFARAIPGPGQYAADAAYKLSGGRISRSRVKSDVDWSILRAANLPGPSDYHDTDCLYRIRGGRISSSRPMTSIGVVERRARESPGPGEYNQELATIGSRSGRVLLRASTPSLPPAAVPRRSQFIPPEARRRPRSRGAGCPGDPPRATSPPFPRPASVPLRPAPASQREGANRPIVVSPPTPERPTLSRKVAQVRTVGSARGYSGEHSGGRGPSVPSTRPTPPPAHPKTVDAGPTATAASNPSISAPAVATSATSAGKPLRAEPLRPPGKDGGGHLRYDLSDDRTSRLVPVVAAAHPSDAAPGAAATAARGHRQARANRPAPNRSSRPAAATAAAVEAGPAGLSAGAQRLLELAMRSPEFRRLLGRFAPDSAAGGAATAVAAAVVERYARAEVDSLPVSRRHKGL